jgi:nicotinamide mononucleotide adenylyltransferase
MKIPAITIHGRFQPPLHINHKNYVLDAFNRAEKVIILITNPNLDESFVKEAGHRSSKENNPFTYEERVEIFQKYFDAIGISKERYEFRPFNITNKDDWDKVLDKSLPNLVNVYGEWSEAKARKFEENGYKVIRTDNPKKVTVSGSDIRRIIEEDISTKYRKDKLIATGYAQEAIEGLFSVLDNK